MVTQVFTTILLPSSKRWSVIAVGLIILFSPTAVGIQVRDLTACVADIANPVHIGSMGNVLTTPSVDSSSATISVRTSMRTIYQVTKRYCLAVVVKNDRVKKSDAWNACIAWQRRARTDIEQTITVSSPSLWSLDAPTLTTLHSLFHMRDRKWLTMASRLLASEKLNTNKDKGFLLNGKHVKMNACACISMPVCLGIAVPEQAWNSAFAMLKEMAANAIRTAHNPPAPEFLDLCDKLGFLVMDEAFDEWEVKRTSGIHYRLYILQKIHNQICFPVIHRDRNHPSVVLVECRQWSFRPGNRPGRRGAAKINWDIS